MYKEEAKGTKWDDDGGFGGINVIIALVVD